jgi:hypothetical protein
MTKRQHEEPVNKCKRDLNYCLYGRFFLNKKVAIKGSNSLDFKAFLMK